MSATVLTLAGPHISATVTPTGAGYDVLLLAHVVCVVASIVAIVVSGAQAYRVLNLGDANPAPSLVRYFAPGTNWFGRVIYGVPIFGFALLGDSSGAYRVNDTWVSIGLVIWLGVAIAAEALIWPAERRLQLLINPSPDNADTADAGSAHERPEARAVTETRQHCLVICLSSVFIVVLMLTATVIMVGKP